MEIKFIAANPQLQQFIQGYIFTTTPANTTNHYVSFANVNLCLSIYKENRISYNRENNFNYVQAGGGQFCTSRLYGFHTQRFYAHINGSMEQLSILFQPGALSFLTKKPYSELIIDENIFSTLFTAKSLFMCEILFSSLTISAKITKLENFLFGMFKNSETNRQMTWLVNHLRLPRVTDSLRNLAEAMHIDNSTLRRRFLDHTGYTPKLFMSTQRFRHALKGVTNKHNLTELSFDLGYYDQNHFIKEFKKFTSSTPSSLSSSISVIDDSLLLLRDNLTA
ncbi:MAG: hypothetical protein JWN76_2479 [Chitinophagaceae bacterium]|nr:hypothetical protein [Chitinophagaceae bacterium]